MPKKLTQEEYKQRVYDCVGDKYTVISEYKGKDLPVTFHCNIHDIDFSVSASCFMRGKENIRGICPECSQDKKREKQIKLKCDYCGKVFYRAPSKINSKSGLVFCCREHKDAATKVQSGERFNSIRPSHYGNGLANYRDKAFLKFPHKCAVCGYDEDERILQVHHKDENHNNNDISNLIILCPNCH